MVERYLFDARLKNAPIELRQTVLALWGLWAQEVRLLKGSLAVHNAAPRTTKKLIMANRVP